MGWEHRGRYGPYYTRSRKVNGRVIREYCGSGRIAELIALLDAEERETRRVKYQERRRERRELDSAEQLLDEFCNAVEILSRAMLYINGYHRHNKGEWRKRREQGNNGN